MLVCVKWLNRRLNWCLYTSLTFWLTELVESASTSVSFRHRPQNNTHSCMHALSLVSIQKPTTHHRKYACLSLIPLHYSSQYTLRPVEVYLFKCRQGHWAMFGIITFRSQKQLPESPNSLIPLVFPSTLICADDAYAIGHATCANKLPNSVIYSI